MPRVVQRGSLGEDLFDIEVKDDDEELRYCPNEFDLIATIAGFSGFEEAPLSTPIELSVTAADVKEARYPALVGHDEGDPIVSAEAALDREFDGIFSLNARLGNYPGALGTEFHHSAPHRHPPGVFVVDLGRVGQLTRASLERAIAEALISYALAQLQPSARPVNRLWATHSDAFSCTCSR